MTHTPMQAYQGNAILLATGHAWAINPDGMTPQQKNQLRNEIVNACNSRASLVEALEKCRTALSSFLGSCDGKEIKDSFSDMESALAQARAALQLAKGGK